MMRPAQLTIVALAALLVTAGANATEYFYEDFESGVAGWTMQEQSFTLTTTSITTRDWKGGAWGNVATITSATGSTVWPNLILSYANTPAVGPEGGTVGNEIQWLSADFRHQGGYPQYNSGTGWKGRSVWFVDANGEGFGLEMVGTRSANKTDVSFRTTNDVYTITNPFSPSNLGGSKRPDSSGWIFLNEMPNVFSNDNWQSHRLEAKLDWTNYILTLYLDGVQVAQEPGVLPLEEAYSDFTQVVIFGMQDHPDGVTIDNIYAGTVQNPHNDPVIVGGDSNSDLLVNLVDLGALATSYGLGGKMWTEGDFNWDLTVDLVDLGILATNYGYDGTGAGVPEPATIGLLLAGGLGLLRRRSG